MKIETKFSNGDEVYGVQRPYINDSWQVIGPMTIGQVRVEVTDSPGIEGETMFDNYKEQKSAKEVYMCIETGIGSGTLHDGERLFATKSEAKAYASCKNAIAA
jgi:hypothetical protein